MSRDKQLTKYERKIAWYWIKAWLDEPELYTPEYIYRRELAAYSAETRLLARRGLTAALAIIQLSIGQPPNV